MPEMSHAEVANILETVYGRKKGEDIPIVQASLKAADDERKIESGEYAPENKCANCGIDLGPVYCPKCYKAVHGEPENNPLTLEELSKRNDPVWVPLDDGTGYWCLCQQGWITPPSCFPFMAEDRPNWTFLDRKPEQEEKL